MGYKYHLYASKYPFRGAWEISKEFETFEEAIKCLSQIHFEGYNIIDFQIRDFEVEE